MAFLRGVLYVGGVLTPREREVCVRLRRGLKDKAIAEDLGISYGAVRFHVGNVLRKLGGKEHSRTLAAVRFRG